MDSQSKTSVPSKTFAVPLSYKGYLHDRLKYLALQSGYTHVLFVKKVTLRKSLKDVLLDRISSSNVVMELQEQTPQSRRGSAQLKKTADRRLNGNTRSLTLFFRDQKVTIKVPRGKRVSEIHIDLDSLQNLKILTKK